MAIKDVIISRAAKKDLQRVPFYISDKLDLWIASVERDGLEEEVNKHDY